MGESIDQVAQGKSSLSAREMRTETKMYAVLTENGSIDWFTGEVAMLMITPAMMIPVWLMTRNMINRSYRPEFPADQQYAKSGVRRLGPNTDVAS